MLKDYLALENLGEEFAEYKNDVRSGLPSAVFGVNFAEKCHLTAMLDLPILYIVKDSFYGARIAE